MGGNMSTEFVNDRWDDLVLLGTARAGGTAPSFAQIGSTGIYTWFFVLNDELHFNAQMPHAWNLGQIKPHVHWEASDSATYTGQFDLTYVWQNALTGSPLSSVVTLNSTFDGSMTANQTQNNNWGLITLSGASISALLLMRFKLSSFTAGTSCIITGFDIHYQRSRNGSINEASLP
jgi:hypothetical protein